MSVPTPTMFKVVYQAIEIGAQKHQGTLMFPADMLGYHQVNNHHLLNKDKLFKVFRTYLFKSWMPNTSINALTDIRFCLSAEGLTGVYTAKELARDPNEDATLLLETLAQDAIPVTAQAPEGGDKPKMSSHKARLVALKTELQDLQIKGQDSRLSKAEVQRISHIKKELKGMRDEQEEFENQVAEGTAKEAEGRGSRYMDKAKRMGREFEDKAFAAFSSKR